MALITPNNPTQPQPLHWRFTWSDSGGPYYVWRFGRIVATVTAATIDVFAPDGSIPIIEVTTALDDVPEQRKHPGRMMIGWYAPLDPPATIAYYRIDQRDGGAWITVDSMAPSPTGYHQWISEHLPDDTVARYQVVPVGSDGYDYDAIDVEALIVRLPDVPAVTYSYDSQTGVVTAS